ncbi:universal stress protein [Ningiella sp. W23]|uniref:universal stress protein n=1 Tax=Ningiella sp. W23 TaxID=3023715 RepID=UPI003758067E
MSQYKKIIVAIDINADYQKVIKKALGICESPKDLTLVYVPLPTVYIQPYLYGAEYNVDDVDRLQRAKDSLGDIAKEFDLSEEQTILKTGYAGDEIKQIADENHADLIVIGTHGRSGIKLLLGSTATSVIHGVNQDVLAVRMHDD